MVTGRGGGAATANISGVGKTFENFVAGTVFHPIGEKIDQSVKRTAMPSDPGEGWRGLFVSILFEQIFIVYTL